MFCRLAVLMAEKDPRLTQSQLAQETGLSPTTVHKLYNNKFGRVDTNTIEVLCSYLDKDIADLFVLRSSKEED